MTDDFKNHPPSIGEIRAGKDQNAASWKPRDVLIDMLRQLDSGEIDPDALVIVHTKVTGPGSSKTAWSASSPNIVMTVGMLNYAQHRIMTVKE